MKRSTTKRATRSPRGKVPSAALFRAIEEANVQQISRLLENKADPNARDEQGMTPLLHVMYRGGSLDLIKRLLSAGADVNGVDESGNTPLIVGARDESLAAVRLLVEHGADLNARNNEGDTPLTNAAIWGERQTGLYLLAQGADPSLADGAGCTAAELARQQGHLDLAEAIDATAAALR